MRENGFLSSGDTLYAYQRTRMSGCMNFNDLKMHVVFDLEKIKLLRDTAFKQLKLSCEV